MLRTGGGLKTLDLGGAFVGRVPLFVFFVSFTKLSVTFAKLCVVAFNAASVFKSKAYIVSLSQSWWRVMLNEPHSHSPQSLPPGPPRFDLDGLAHH
jgi:hypothetical protein